MSLDGEVLVNGVDGSQFFLWRSYIFEDGVSRSRASKATVRLSPVGAL